MAAAGAVPAGRLGEVVLLGELGLDGRVRATRGVLPAVLAASRAGVSQAVVPTANAAEAALVPQIEVRGVERLADLVDYFRDGPDRTVLGRPGSAAPDRSYADLGAVGGQAPCRR